MPARLEQSLRLEFCDRPPIPALIVHRTFSRRCSSRFAVPIPTSVPGRASIFNQPASHRRDQIV